MGASAAQKAQSRHKAGFGVFAVAYAYRLFSINQGTKRPAAYAIAPKINSQAGPRPSLLPMMKPAKPAASRSAPTT